MSTSLFSARWQKALPGAKLVRAAEPRAKPIPIMAVVLVCVLAISEHARCLSHTEPAQPCDKFLPTARWCRHCRRHLLVPGIRAICFV